MNLLITGGTGYFGQAFAKAMIDSNEYERICIYSRGEYAQHLMREKFHDERLRFFIGDVRDQQRLEISMRGIDVVVHAAALKRVEVGEYNPTEMVRTNVDGTRNVITAALNSGHDMRVIYLSTDKACAPMNAYGASKLMGEKMMLAANNVAGEQGPIFSVTRYGNVAGSTGSVIPTWRKIGRQGGMLPVTDPNCTRFWMSSQEAIDLVEWTTINMIGGEIVVPSLPAYSVTDLVAAMEAGAYLTGLNPGEKLHEEMLTDHEAKGFTRDATSGYWISDRFEARTGEERQHGMRSDTARRMTVEEIKQRLEEIDG